MNIIHCNQISHVPLGHLVFIDGKANLTKVEFLHCIWKQLEFPYPQYQNWDGYLDWMRDLSLLKTKTISIIITNFELFLSKDPTFRKYFMSDFEEVIFSFWENDAEEVFGNNDDIKDINVYCLNKETPNNEQISTKEAAMLIRQNALNGYKAPHSTSQLVLRLHNGKLCFAAFVFFYNREQLQSAMVNRPSVWVVSDLKTGEIVQRYSCQDKEFANKDYKKFYNISLENILYVEEDYWNTSYALMDLIIDEYMSFGTINKNLYKQYLERIYKITPEEYKVFYEDLNNIGVF